VNYNSPVNLLNLFNLGVKRKKNLEVRISILSIKTEKTDEIEKTEEADKYLSIFFNPLNPFNYDTPLTYF